MRHIAGNATLDRSGRSLAVIIACPSYQAHTHFTDTVYARALYTSGHPILQPGETWDTKDRPTTGWGRKRPRKEWQVETDQEDVLFY